MTDAEKLAIMKAVIAPDTDTDEVLTAMLTLSAAQVLNRLYPFGYAENISVPSRYEQLQIELAVEIYSKRGAEGQTGHSENGITRSWPEKSRILSQIVPHCGSVNTNEES